MIAVLIVGAAVAYLAAAAAAAYAFRRFVEGPDDGDDSVAAPFGLIWPVAVPAALVLATAGTVLWLIHRAATVPDRAHATRIAETDAALTRLQEARPATDAEKKIISDAREAHQRERDRLRRSWT